ncbi:glycosyltransferase [Photobacterium leiognathi]|uniref:glycosyltransferase n=1 Tax=Photobacterium leiognathi TaxID=553611 RepID=UPI0029820818|nr:glycosyltransferase [Photobacterium leiognathi]
MKNVDVIIPVYRGLEETIECIESAVRSLPEWANLIIINDCSPEPELSDWLANNAEIYGYELHNNVDNLGFVATVNFGMSLHPENDVLLLNSDVEVANSDWLYRIREHAYSQANIGSVTPFSNNATICSFPNFCEDNELFLNQSVDELDAHFKQLPLAKTFVEVPTGVGFCMYIRRDCLNEVGLFDVETFGKGYGEENDWCQRAIKSGWLNTHLLNVFAYHKGGVSFAAEQDPRKEKALELLLEKHPEYTRDVMTFIDQDPAKYARRLALLSMIKSNHRHVVAMISHSLGGGVQQHIEEQIKYYSDDIIALLIRPINEHQVEMSFWSGIQCLDKMVFTIEEQWNEFIVCLKEAGIDRIHYHHLMGMNPKILTLPAELHCHYDITIHDFFFVNGNPTLTSNSGLYVGENHDVDQLCAEHYPIPVSADEWRKAYKPFLEKADRVIYPSQDCYNVFNKFYDIEDNAIIAWHIDNEEAKLENDHNKSLPVIDSTRPLKILCIGALGLEKGGLLLESVAKNIGNEHQFSLLGYAFKALDSVKTYGKYEQSNIDELIAEINPDVIWFPAQWPETYCYTLSAALRSKAFIVAPNIGAFSERLENYDRGIITSWEKDVTEWADFWRQFHKGNIQSLPKVSANKRVTEFYQKHYLSDAQFSPIGLTDEFLYRLDMQKKLEDITADIPYEPSERHYQPVPHIGIKQSLIQLGVSTRKHPSLSSFFDRIPLKYQQKIKDILVK